MLGTQRPMVFAIVQAALVGIALLGDEYNLAGNEKTPKKWPLLDKNETVAEYAARVGLPASQTPDLGGGVSMELVLVPAGTFMMGADLDSVASWNPSSRPIHKVTFTKPFYIGKYEVTVGKFRRFAEAANYQTESERSGNGPTVRDGKWQSVPGASWKNIGFDQTPEHPAGLLTWNDARAFVAWMSRQTGGDVRLPTEAQWEYAARGPKNFAYPWGDTWDGTKLNHGDVSLKNAGWAGQELSEANDGFAFASPVGSYAAGRSWCGACDMAGNLWEWCEDCEAPYKAEAVLDPQPSE